MSPFPLALVVLAAVLHATWNLLAKRGAAAGASFVFSYNFLCCLVFLPWVAILVWRGAVHWSWPVLACLLAGGTIHLAYSLILQRAYQLADLSVVYPVARGTGPTLSSIGAFALFGEVPSVTGITGLLAVVIGIGLIATRGDLAAFRRPGGQTGVRWGIATGIPIACYTVVDAYGVKALGIEPVVLDWCSNLMRFALLAPLVLRDREGARLRMRGKWHLALGVGVLSSLAYILVLTALGMGAPLSVVAPVREMSLMIGALFGMVVLREPVGGWRLAGCGAVLAGVVLLGRI